MFRCIGSFQLILRRIGISFLRARLCSTARVRAQGFGVRADLHGFRLKLRVVVNKRLHQNRSSDFVRVCIGDLLARDRQGFSIADTSWRTELPHLSKKKWAEQGWPFDPGGAERFSTRLLCAFSIGKVNVSSTVSTIHPKHPLRQRICRGKRSSKITRVGSHIPVVFSHVLSGI